MLQSPSQSFIVNKSYKPSNYHGYFVSIILCTVGVTKFKQIIWQVLCTLECTQSEDITEYRIKRVNKLDSFGLLCLSPVLRTCRTRNICYYTWAKLGIRVPEWRKTKLAICLLATLYLQCVAFVGACCRRLAFICHAVLPMKMTCGALFGGATEV